MVHSGVVFVLVVLVCIGIAAAKPRDDQVGDITEKEFLEGKQTVTVQLLQPSPPYKICAK